MSRTVYGDHARFIDTYFRPIPGQPPPPLPPLSPPLPPSFLSHMNLIFRIVLLRRRCYPRQGSSLILFLTRSLQDGHITITGRVDDVIKVSGHRLGTAEIESALVSHAAVAEAAVVGYPHDIKGEGASPPPHSPPPHSPSALSPSTDTLPPPATFSNFLFLQRHLWLAFSHPYQLMAGVYAYVILKSGHSESEELLAELRQTVRKDLGAFAAPDYILVRPFLSISTLIPWPRPLASPAPALPPAPAPALIPLLHNRCARCHASALTPGHGGFAQDPLRENHAPHPSQYCSVQGCPMLPTT
jgi:acyl-CoA synthetase (AMP-forming)/AMP-acid ligase II